MRAFLRYGYQQCLIRLMALESPRSDDAMRTLIRGGWVVGFGGVTHTLIRNGVVVYEGNRIIHVAANSIGRETRVIIGFFFYNARRNPNRRCARWDILDDNRI